MNEDNNLDLLDLDDNDTMDTLPKFGGTISL